MWNEFNDYIQSDFIKNLSVLELRFYSTKLLSHCGLSDLFSI